MDAEEKGFLAAIKKNPKDATARSAFADWLDEHERPYEAALQRAKAGLSEVYYKIRRKKDGLFSTGSKGWATMGWSEGGKMWRRLTDLLAHMRGIGGSSRDYGGTPWRDLEVVFCEVRVTFTATLPLKTVTPRGWGRPRHTVTEPLGGGKETNSED
jgi:uncharacterized protein (TIGR02996 family)